MTVRLAAPGMSPWELEVPAGARVRDALRLSEEKFAQPIDLSKASVWVNGERVADLDREVPEKAQLVVFPNFIGG